MTPVHGHLMLTNRSGKSSLLSTLLRLLEIQDGRITVDGVDLSGIPRDLIRQRCFVTIAQDPFLVPDASVRFNLDPSEGLPDSVLVTALQKTGLWHLFSARDDITAIFDSPLSALPTLSVGQSQLMALARAILQMRVASEPSETAFADYPTARVRKPIVLLDEATSSLDPETEAAVYDAIQDEFIGNGHTVIIVTHKPGMCADRLKGGVDRVVWMREGRVDRIGEGEELVNFDAKTADLS